MESVPLYVPEFGPDGDALPVTRTMSPFSRDRVLLVERTPRVRVGVRVRARTCTPPWARACPAGIHSRNLFPRRA